MKNPLGRDISHIQITAAVAVLALIGIGIWQAVGAVDQKSTAGTFVAATTTESGAQNAEVASSTMAALETTDPISQVSTNALGEIVGAYTGLEQTGQYSTSSAAEVADSIGMGLQAPVSYEPIDASQVLTNSETSYQAMMDYRASLQTTLKPLMNDTMPEYEIFGLYVQTKDPKYLTELQAAAENYQTAASSTEAIVVPADAVEVQLGLVNSMNEFASDLDALADHADDPIASSILLENYNQGENDVLTAFQDLVTYEQSKTQ